jgi:hypothetical protein
MLSGHNTEVGFRPIEKAEHHGCCGRIPLDSGRNRNPVQGSGTSTNQKKNWNVQPSHHNRGQTHHRSLTKKEAAASPPPVFQLPHHRENVYKSRQLGLI